MEADALYRKIAWRIMPVLFIGYIVAYLDRVNVGFAKLQMLGDLHFSEAVYGAGSGIFFLGYFLFEVPSNVVLHRIGARLWISRIMVVWAMVSALNAFVHTRYEFYAVRFLLGVAEAGFFPGMILYLTYWFPSHRRAKMAALLMGGIPVSGILGGPLSGFILRHFTASPVMAGWQWLFVIEAIPAILLGVYIFFFLDNKVAEARWLSDGEKARVAAEIDAEGAEKIHTGLKAVFLSARVWLMIAIYFGQVMGSYAISFWLPTIITGAGIADPFMVGLLTILPYTLAFIAMILVGRSADRMRERRWHVIVPLAVSAIGFVLCILGGHNIPMAMTGLTLAAIGVTSALPMFWSLPTAFLGSTAAAAGIAWINCTSNLAGFFSPAIIGFLKDRTGTLDSGLWLVTASVIASALLVLILVPAKLVNR